jgi:hypothetical protein
VENLEIDRRREEFLYFHFVYPDNQVSPYAGKEKQVFSIALFPPGGLAPASSFIFAFSGVPPLDAQEKLRICPMELSLINAFFTAAPVSDRSFASRAGRIGPCFFYLFQIWIPLKALVRFYKGKIKIFGVSVDII